MDESDFDWDEAFTGLGEDWEVIETVLPEGWQEAAKHTGALMRTRGFDSAATLLRVLLIHLVDGCSLRETAVRAQAGGLAKVSDVALLGRLRGSGEWFRWMVEQMSQRLSSASQEVLPGKRVRLVDASVVCEPGATGSTWRLHYMIDLSTLACEQVQVTLPEEGETLTRFTVRAGDVLMADRGLAHRRGIRHVVAHEGEVIVRMNLISVPLEDAKGRAMALLPRLRKLAIGQARAWPAVIRDEHGSIAVRVCALKKSAEQTRKSQEKVRQIASRKGRELQPDTLEAAGYVVVLTTLPEVPPARILELYRHRWQIELAFKRLKSLLHLGHLKKTDPVGAKAWLQGKLFVATLIETLIAVGERFSPWGYFLPKDRQPSVPVA
jgi:Transposase DDE domain